MSEPIDLLFSTPEMAAVFSAENHVRQLLAFEAALVKSEARAGVIPENAAAAIVTSCRVELFDVPQLYRDAASAGTVVIPLVHLLTAKVEPKAQAYVHWGATSQDAIDTATVLQMRQGIVLLTADLLKVCERCANLAIQHRHTLMAGRTLLQQALPITFGLKAARWLALVTRQVSALCERRARSLTVQLGGAAGTLAALEKEGLRVAEFLGEELGLPVPELPWHAERDRITAIAGTVGVIAGSMAKIANDIILLAQTEVAEVAEAAAPDKGGSSALPQKRNPVDAIAALAAARLAIGLVPGIMSAMDNEHERGAGGWQAEWAAIPKLFCYAAGAVARVQGAVRGLRVDAQQMLANLEGDGGLLMAESVSMTLARKVGRPEAQRLVKEVCDHAVTRGVSLRQAALENDSILTNVSGDEIARALDPANFLGSADDLIDRALESYQKVAATDQ
jgi:3-carboxy-cis,cis-muconate cycloisomerase